MPRFFWYQLNFRIPARSSRLRNIFRIERYESNYTLNNPVNRMVSFENNLNIDLFNCEFLRILEHNVIKYE